MPLFRLAHTVDELCEYLATPNWEVGGLDLESTSLNTRLARLVGLSVSIDNDSAMYAPTGHRVGTNLPLAEVVTVLVEAFANKLAVMSYAPYDLNVWQANTGWYPPKFIDVIEQIYLQDPDRKRKGLKLVAKEELGVDMGKFETLFSPEEIDAGILDISSKLPERCVEYACADAYYVRQLHFLPKFYQILTDHKFPVAVDTDVANIIRKTEHNGGMVLNREYIDKQIVYLQRMEDTLREQIHRVVGRPFEIHSPKQLGIALFEWLAIPHVGKTKGKNPIYKTGADDLENLAKTYQIVDTVLTYRKIVKCRTTYFMKLLSLSDSGKPVRFNFNIYSAPTFRFSAPGGDPDVDGATGVNIQAVSNGAVQDMWGVDLSPEAAKGTSMKQYEIPEDEAAALLGAPAVPKKIELVQIDPEGFENKPYVVKTDAGAPVCVRETCKGCNAGCQEKGYDVTRRIIKNVFILPSVRQAFMAPEGYVLLSADFMRQELVIGANLSKDPIWLEALKEGRDLHEQTAADGFLMILADFRLLPKKEYKQKRGLGKIINFAVFYGATYRTVARQAGIAEDVAEKMLKNFMMKHEVLFDWIERVQAFAQKNGYTTTYWGRKRSLKQFYDEGSYGMKAFADRSAVNTCIQGTAAEATRIALVRVEKLLRKAGYKMKDVSLQIQLHDELTYLIRTDILEAVAPLVAEGMRFKVPEWEVQLDVDAKCGTVWGDQAPFAV